MITKCELLLRFEAVLAQLPDPEFSRDPLCNAWDEPREDAMDFSSWNVKDLKEYATANGGSPGMFFWPWPWSSLVLPACLTS